MNHDAWRAALADVPLPAAVVDVGAFDRNVARARAAVADHRGEGGAPVRVRVAHKSLRCLDLLRRALDGLGPVASGVLAFQAAEVRALAAAGFDDLLLAYPPARRWEGEALGEAARYARVRVAIDDDRQLDGLDPSVEICVDADASLRIAGQHLGARRSPIRTPEAALRVAEAARARGHRVTAVMIYESAVAGLPDHDPRWWMRPPLRWVKAQSAAAAAEARSAIVGALRAAGHPIDVVNGGGTGSLRVTPGDGSVSEVAVGSAFYAPHTFDGFDGLSLEPALFLVMPVCRVPGPGWVTVSGPGVVATGAAGAHRWPVVVAPAGLAPIPDEGFGEVQTPLRVPPGCALTIGDPVVLRPAKAGEPLDRFREVWPLFDGRVGAPLPTLRVADLMPPW